MMPHLSLSLLQGFVSLVLLLIQFPGSVCFLRQIGGNCLKEAYFYFASKKIPSVREAAHVIGLLVSAFPAVFTVICSIIDPLNRVNLRI